MANPVKDFPVQKEPTFFEKCWLLVPTSREGGRWNGVIYVILFHRTVVTGADWLVQTVLLDKKTDKIEDVG